MVPLLPLSDSARGELGENGVNPLCGDRAGAFRVDIVMVITH